MGYCIWKSYNFSQDAWPIFEAVKEEKNCFFLDSGINNTLGRYSFLGFEPFYILNSKKQNSFEDLRRLLKAHKVKKIKNTPPFLAGAVGFFSYDFGLLLEDKLKGLYKNETLIPDFYFAFYNSIIIIDHLLKELFVFSINQQSFKKTIQLLSELDFKRKDRASDIKYEHQPESNFLKNDYLKAIKKAKDYISKGDIYQVNLSQKFSAKTNLEAGDIYGLLRKTSPSSFSAYLDGGDFQVISSSPERFLSLKDRLVHTRPMKGTRPRHLNRRQDKKMEKDLLESAKDRAELMMIVDLMRNDLGRVCEYSSIKVKSLRNLEKYKTVFQTTADITGVLHKDMDAIDLIRASFPGGSITGCPKIRAMEIIQELEPEPRNIYTGSLGYFSFCGNMDFNILIRTILKQGNSLSFSVGGGIVADSRPESEYEETLVKAKGILEAIS